MAHGEGTLGKLVTDRTLYDDAAGVFSRLRRSMLLRLIGGSESKP